MATKEEIIKKISDICETFDHEIEVLSTYGQVSHLSQAKIQFNGGILGAIREYREDKRLVKLINKPIVDGYSFYSYAIHICQQADAISSLIMEYQKIVSKDSEDYYVPIEPAINTTMKAFTTWYNLSPDMAVAPITIGDEKDVALGPSVKLSIKESFAKLDLPEKYNFFKEQDTQSSNSGCLSTLVLLSTSIIGLIVVLLIIL